MPITIKKGPDLTPVGSPDAIPNGVSASLVKKNPPPKKPAPAPDPAPSPNIKAKEVSATVTTTHKDGSQEDEVIPVTSVMVPDRHATVGITMNLTRNLGNYESVKFGVHLSMPCDPEADAIEEAYEFTKAWVDDKASIINQEVTDQLGG